MAPGGAEGGPPGGTRDAALHRFARHHALRGLGVEGQQRIRDGRVLVVGVGGLGSPAARYLAAAGVGRITLCDLGRVDAPDLQRQVLFGDPDLGRPKATTAAKRLREAHPEVDVQAVDAPFAAALVAGHDVVLDGTDDVASRLSVQQACREAGVPLVWGALEGWTGEITTLEPGGPCLACLVAPDLDAPACKDIGVFAPLAGTVGTMMAGEALKSLAGLRTLRGRLVVIDALDGSMETVRYVRREDCSACTTTPSTVPGASHP